MGTRWTKYVARLQNLFVAMGISSKNRKKMPYCCILQEQKYLKFTKLWRIQGMKAAMTKQKKRKTYFKPRVNKEFEIYEFRKMKQ